jgi:hypothetical protein
MAKLSAAIQSYLEDYKIIVSIFFFGPFHDNSLDIVLSFTKYGISYLRGIVGDYGCLCNFVIYFMTFVEGIDIDFL